MAALYPAGAAATAALALTLLATYSRVSRLLLALAAGRTLLSGFPLDPAGTAARLGISLPALAATLVIALLPPALTARA